MAEKEMVLICPSVEKHQRENDNKTDAKWLVAHTRNCGVCIALMALSGNSFPAVILGK